MGLTNFFRILALGFFLLATSTMPASIPVDPLSLEGLQKRSTENADSIRYNIALNPILLTANFELNSTRVTGNANFDVTPSPVPAAIQRRSAENAGAPSNVNALLLTAFFNVTLGTVDGNATFVVTPSPVPAAVQRRSAENAAAPISERGLWLLTANFEVTIPGGPVNATFNTTPASIQVDPLPLEGLQRRSEENAARSVEISVPSLTAKFDVNLTFSDTPAPSFDPLPLEGLQKRSGGNLTYTVNINAILLTATFDVTIGTVNG